MIGYWVETNPVKTGNAEVLTTSYLKDKSALITLASWAKGNTTIKLKIDWEALGINPAKAIITVPERKGFMLIIK